MSNALVLTPLNGEPRIHDLLLAEQLGFEEPRSIRKLIKRNEDKLLQFGVLFKKQCMTITKKPYNEYYLNKEQISFIKNVSCIKCNNKSHIYVVEFSNCVIKVGHSDNIKRRIDEYKKISQIFNCEVKNVYTELQLNTTENNIISFCNKNGNSYIGKEYFVNIKFDDIIDFIKNNNNQFTPAELEM